MNTVKHRSYASRLGSAKTLINAITNLSDYVAVKPEVELTAITQIVTDIEAVNENVVEKETAYKNAVKTRQMLFNNDDDGVQKLLAPLRSYLLAFYGEDDVTYLKVNKQVQKIRGAKSPTIITNDADEIVQSITNVETTYVSKTQCLKEIITELNLVSASYSPTNPIITLESLQAKYDTIQIANTAVDTALNNLKVSQSQRRIAFEELSNISKLVKQFVKSQYGTDSVAYGQIKSLVI